MTPGALGERTIRLRLPRSTRAAFAGCAAFGLLGLVLAFDAEARTAGLLSAAFFGGLALASGVIPREVTFGADALTLRSRLRPVRHIAYRDITGFGLDRLKARGARFGWAPYENAAEVNEAFDALLADGSIPLDPLSDDLVEADLAGLEASTFGLYALVGAAVVLSVLALSGVPLWDAPEWVYQVVLPLGVFGGTTGAAYWVIRRRMRRDDHEGRD